jgi:hypothetical protein
MLSFQKITTICSASLGKWPSFVMYHKTSHSYILVIKFNNINILLFSIPLHHSSFETLFPYFKTFQNIFPASVSCLKNHIKNRKNKWENKIILICYDNHLQNWEIHTVSYFSPEIKNKCLIFHSFPMSTKCSLVTFVNFLSFHNVVVDKGAHLQFTPIFLNWCLNVIRQKCLTTNMCTYIHHIVLMLLYFPNYTSKAKETTVCDLFLSKAFLWGRRADKNTPQRNKIFKTTLYPTSEKFVSSSLLQQKIKYQVYFIHPKEY